MFINWTRWSAYRSSGSTCKWLHSLCSTLASEWRPLLRRFAFWRLRACFSNDIFMVAVNAFMSYFPERICWANAAILTACVPNHTVGRNVFIRLTYFNQSSGEEISSHESCNDEKEYALRRLKERECFSFYPALLVAGRMCIGEMKNSEKSEQRRFQRGNFTLVMQTMAA